LSEALRLLALFALARLRLGEADAAIFRPEPFDLLRGAEHAPGIDLLFLEETLELAGHGCLRFARSGPVVETVFEPAHPTRGPFSGACRKGLRFLAHLFAHGEPRPPSRSAVDARRP